MEAIVRERGGLKLRRIDIDQWGSPVAKQYGIRSLPALYLYEGTRLVSQDTSDVLKRITR